jgi:transcriptional regulator with XRE-family HTH domain
MNTARETLGQRLQRLRVQTGLTQAALAAATETSLATLRNWENDRREPGWRAACLLARALGITVEDLADTVPLGEAERVARPAGPTRRPTPPQTGEPATKKRRQRKGAE